MKIKDIRADFINSLVENYDHEEILSFFYILSEEIIGLRRVDVAIDLDRILSEDEVSRFEDAKKRIINQEPIQYIIGNTHFYGLSFKVNKDVLIPRPETEELVDWILKDLQDVKDQLRVLDIGTGSGCIAISLAKKLPNANVFAMDISDKAIDTARENAKINEVDITFIHSDILNVQNLPHNFDIIVSNPPYVRELEKQEMKPNVLDNEPSQALFVSDHDPLIFYRKITELAKRNLKPEGVLYFEINQYLGTETKSMIESSGFNSVALRKDVYDNERMIRARLN